MFICKHTVLYFVFYSGVGYSLNSKLLQLAVTTCADMQNLPLNMLQKELGPKTGQTMYNSCQGLDQRPIKMEKERKSVSTMVLDLLGSVFVFFIPLIGTIQTHTHTHSVHSTCN